MGTAVIENHAGEDHAEALLGAGQGGTGKVQRCITPCVFTNPFRMVVLALIQAQVFVVLCILVLALSLSISLTLASAVHTRFFILFFISMMT